MRVRACVRACVHACVRACVRAQVVSLEEVVVAPGAKVAELTRQCRNVERTRQLLALMVTVRDTQGNIQLLLANEVCAQQYVGKSQSCMVGTGGAPLSCGRHPWRKL